MTHGALTDRFGPFILRETLGHGPSGTVYRATESDTGREIALKVVALHPDGESDSLLRDLRATNTLRAAAALHHPGIVRVERVDAVAGYTAVEMEYVRGMSLRDMLGIVGVLPPERASAISSQILDALAYAHARGVSHGDLKPTNVLIRYDGMVKLCDFGSRGACPDPATIRSLQIHCYAAPEELEAGRVPDRRSDVWSVGALLFHMLTGRLPFPISDPHDPRAWERGLKAIVPRQLPRTDSDTISPLQSVLDRALRYDPDERFANAREFLNAVLATGLCAGMIDTDDEPQEHQNATYRRIDESTRNRFEADEETALPAVIRAFAQTSLDWEDSADTLDYADSVEDAGSDTEDVRPNVPMSSPDSSAGPTQMQAGLDSVPEDIADEDPEATSFGSRRGPLRSHGSVSDADVDPEATVERRFERAGAAPAVAHMRRKRNPYDGAELVFVEAGEFAMGSDGFAEENGPQHAVWLDDYYIYRFPVTVGQYRHYCEESAYPMPHVYWQTDDREPIVGVSWEEARAYAEWAHMRLPTEAQWEKAARGVVGRTFPWGDQLDLRSTQTFVPNNLGRTAAVGTCPSGSSPYGAMDMVGNVQQWCLDHYDDDYYKSAPYKNPEGPLVSSQRRAAKAGLVHKLFHRGPSDSPHSGDLRVVRGSSWKDRHESFAFTFRREAFAADARLPWVGFRCAGLPSCVETS